jgi:hypothetical protein
MTFSDLKFNPENGRPGRPFRIRNSAIPLQNPTFSDLKFKSEKVSLAERFDRCRCGHEPLVVLGDLFGFEIQSRKRSSGETFSDSKFGYRPSKPDFFGSEIQIRKGLVGGAVRPVVRRTDA